ncbi:MAG: HPr family phosphocarrier protein [Pontiellaceae bacterium]|nr:HPr family phosphocarrier protein [Pontiellaceae bacterium]MBN2786210.1 HPr family phosphocarrier protein [Pontiellaceae bacterium]
MKTYDLTIAAPHGLHIRVAAKIVELVRRSGARVRLFDRENRTADGDSIISLMMLGAEHGHLVRVEVEGRNEESVGAGLAELFSEPAAA